MKKLNQMRFPAATFTVLAAATLMTTGCARQSDHQTFKTPEAAVEAFVAALEKDDTAALQRLLGPGSEDLLSSGDAVQDKGDRADFLAAYGKRHSIVDEGADLRHLVIGEKDWEFPIPLTNHDGNWGFDSEAGADELVYRRVGANELGAISVARGFVDAQIEYASEGRDGDEPGIYALKLISDEGQHNGLYWPTAEGEEPSPVGSFVADAASEGYRRTSGAYHGYHYRLLYQQGEHANGGARDYFKDGVMTQGFALVAWPAEHEVSGVMTFIVNQDGVVFQKDLGEDTEAAVAAMDSFDPDSSWVAVTDSSEDTPEG
jgi:hypothetical protein